MEIIPNNRCGSKLCYQGYMYTKHATRKTNQWWKCVKRSSIGCRGNLSTRQSDICIGGWDWRSWTRVSNCAFEVFFTGQQGLDIVVTLGHNLGKYLAGFVSVVGCQVFHGISGFWIIDACNQPTVPGIRQQSEWRKQNVCLLLTRQFGKIS
jgi:hypothetical protein